MDEWITLQFDGGSRGNPGPAGIGVVVQAADGTPLVTLGRYIGRATNNVAEYRALITALERARELGAKRIQIRGDSELIIKQMRGEYRVKHPDMRVLYDQARELVRGFEDVKIEHNLRHKNALADKLANLAMDRRADVTDVNGAAPADPVPPTRRGTSGARGAVTPAPSPLDAPTPVAPKPGDRFACVRCGCVIRLEKPSGIRPHQLKPFACQCGTKMLAAPGE
jgi:ribonuclease HI